MFVTSHDRGIAKDFIRPKAAGRQGDSQKPPASALWVQRPLETGGAARGAAHYRHSSRFKYSSLQVQQPRKVQQPLHSGR